MIKRIGFFHYVEHYDRPIESLATALSGGGGITDSLIVLPEAFNNGKFYDDEPRMAPRLAPADAMRDLAGLARQFGVVFVAGLLDPPHNLAVLVSQDGDKLLAYKKSNDRTGNYEPWHGPDPANPIMIDDVCVGILLCNEVDYPNDLIAKLDRHNGVRKVICVPACMSSAYFSGDSMAYEHWLGKYTVLANSREYGCGSFITDTKGKKVITFGYPRRLGQDGNQIIHRTWSELDGTPPVEM